MAKTTARPASAMSTIFAGGRLRSGVAMSWVTLMPTPGPRSSPGGLGADGWGLVGTAGGLGVSSGISSLDFTRVGEKNPESEVWRLGSQYHKSRSQVTGLRSQANHTSSILVISSYGA